MKTAGVQVFAPLPWRSYGQAGVFFWDRLLISIVRCSIPHPPRSYPVHSTHPTSTIWRLLNHQLVKYIEVWCSRRSGLCSPRHFMGTCRTVFVFVHLYLYLCMCAFVFYWMSIFATCVKLKADPVSVWKVKRCWKQLPRLLGVFQQCRVRLGQDRSVWQFFCLLKTKRMLAAAAASSRSFSLQAPSSTVYDLTWSRSDHLANNLLCAENKTKKWRLLGAQSSKPVINSVESESVNIEAFVKRCLLGKSCLLFEQCS